MKRILSVVISCTILFALVPHQLIIQCNAEKSGLNQPIEAIYANEELASYEAEYDLSDLNMAEYDDVIIDGNFDEKGNWRYSLRTAAVTGEQRNGTGTVSLITYDGHDKNGCILFDMQDSGYKTINALQWLVTMNDSKPVIEKGRSYEVSFYAKLEGTDSFTVNTIRFRHPTSNNIFYSTSSEQVELSGEGWQKYSVILTADETVNDVMLIFQAGKDNISNFKLYIDDVVLRVANSSLSLRCEPEFENITSLFGSGNYATGSIAEITAVSKGDYLLDKWVDSYGNTIWNNSTEYIPITKNQVLTAVFKPYSAMNLKASVSSKADKPFAELSCTQINGDNIKYNGSVSLPAGYTVSEYGILTYPGHYAENFNIFTKGANIIKANTPLSDGKFTLSAENTQPSLGLLAKSYMIYNDKNGHTGVVYSDEVFTPSTLEDSKKPYKMFYYHELMACFTNPGTLNKEKIQSYIESIADTDTDAVTVCPTIYRTNLFVSKVDPQWTDLVLYNREYTGYTNTVKYMNTVKEYILGGGDLVLDTVSACRAYGKDVIMNYRLNDHHNTNDVNFPTHNSFWRDHPEYWLNDTDEGDYERLFNYMIPKVRQYYYDIIEELSENYDIDGFELDFMRWLKFFHPEDIAEGTLIMNDFVGSIRAMLDRVGAERGKYLQLSVRVPASLEQAKAAGLDIEEWDRRGYIDIANVSSQYRQSLELDIEGYKDTLDNTKIFAENHFVTYQIGSGNARRYTTGEMLLAAASNFFARGADGLSFFNFEYYPQEVKADIKKYLKGITDPDVLRTADKQYVISPNYEIFSANKEVRFNLVIPDDTSSGIFENSVFRVETQNSCQNSIIDVYINGVRLEKIEHDPELFPKVFDTEAYPKAEVLSHYRVPLDILKKGENEIYITVVSGEDLCGKLFSAELALYSKHNEAPEITVSGTLKQNEPLTFTANFSGGNGNDEYYAYVLKEGVIHKRFALYEIPVFEFTPTEKGTYQIRVYCTDSVNKRRVKSLNFTVN